MKRSTAILILYFIVMLLTGLTATAQTKVTKDAQGNFKAISSTKVKTADKATGKTFEAKDGTKYDVYESKNGKLYYNRTSKAGNQYKVYLKTL